MWHALHQRATYLVGGAVMLCMELYDALIPSTALMEQFTNNNSVHNLYIILCNIYYYQIGIYIHCGVYATEPGFAGDIGAIEV